MLIVIVRLLWKGGLHHQDIERIYCLLQMSVPSLVIGKKIFFIRELMRFSLELQMDLGILLNYLLSGYKIYEFIGNRSLVTK